MELKYIPVNPSPDQDFGPVRAFVLLDRQEARGTSIAPMSKLEAFTELYSGAYLRTGRSTAESVNAMKRLVEHAMCVRLTYSEADRAAPYLADWLNEQA